MPNFFDQPHYRLNKLFMSQLGIWPEQSLFMRIVINFLHVLNLGSIMILEIIRMIEVWGDASHVIECLPPLFVIFIAFTKLFNGSLNIKKARKLLARVKDHWTRLANKPNIKILNEYGNRGHLITLYYSMYVYASMCLYLTLPLMPIVLDIIMPLNETRPRKLLFEAEYWVDEEEYFWQILFHMAEATVTTVMMLVAADTMYFMLVEHCCGLFEMVGVNMQTANEAQGGNVDKDYKRISYCVDLHREALAFADLIELNYTGSFTLIIGLSVLAMTISLVQIVLKLGSIEDMIRYGTFVAGQVSHLFFNSIPGQKIINYSLRIHESVYASDWIDFDIKNQKLVMIIMMRAQKPCRLSAGKVYVMSMESFSSDNSHSAAPCIDLWSARRSCAEIAAKKDVCNLNFCNGDAEPVQSLLQKIEVIQTATSYFTVLLSMI